jgi:hypothetical protein
MFKINLKLTTRISLILILLSYNYVARAGWRDWLGCCSRAELAARGKFLQEQARLAASLGYPKWGQDPARPLRPGERPAWAEKA